MTDYDSPWKTVLERYFPAFLEFYFPAAHAGIDWSRGYTLLDKELQKVARDAALGRRWADVLALPYIEASQSAVLKQGFSFGVPAVVTRVGGLPDEVRDGENGLMIEPLDPPALADRVRESAVAALAAYEPGLGE